jgi:Holliday junction resolvase-like predicted endonuclease
LDIVATKEDCLTFVEVKVVDHIEDIDGYVTPKKLGFLTRAIEWYLTAHPSQHEIVLDVAFVH